MQYDLVVIGGGPGGYTGAIRAAKLGMKVALVEERDLGGTCLNRGCIPTKSLLHSAELLKSAPQWADYGVSAENVSFDEAKAYAHKDSIVGTLRSGIESLVKANKIDLYKCKGYINNAHSIRCGDEILETAHILIATGSKPSGFDPSRPIKGLEYTLNSDDVLGASVNGNNIVIIGAGVIGVEFAGYYGAIGKNVTLLCSGDRILKMMSKDISLQLAGTFKREGVKIIGNAKVSEITEDKTVVYNTGEQNAEIKADAVILAAGRTANISDIGLENIGITAGRFIDVDDNMFTGVGGVYACGDATNGVQLAHYAAASAITAVESMLKKDHSIDLSLVPSCIYTAPEIATVGKKETEVENAKVGKFLMGANGKAFIEGANRGFIKVIADQNDVVVGAELFCVKATDIMGELTLAIGKKLKVCDLTSIIRPHPTVMESVGEALEDIHGLATHMLPKVRNR